MNSYRCFECNFTKCVGGRVHLDLQAASAYIHMCAHSVRVMHCMYSAHICAQNVRYVHAHSYVLTLCEAALRSHQPTIL